MRGSYLVGDCLLSIKPQEKSEGLQLNFQQVRQRSRGTGICRFVRGHVGYKEKPFFYFSRRPLNYDFFLQEEEDISLS